MGTIQGATGPLSYYEPAAGKPAVKFLDQAKVQEKIVEAAKTKGSEILIQTAEGSSLVALDLFLAKPEKYAHNQPALLVLELPNGESVGIELARLSKTALFKALEQAQQHVPDQLRAAVQESAAPILSRIRGQTATAATQQTKPASQTSQNITPKLDKILKDADVDTLLMKAFSRNAGVRDPAVAGLNALRDKLLSALSQWNGPPELKQAFASQLRSYDFAKLAAMPRLEQMEAFAPGLTDKIDGLIQALPAAQQAQARDLADSLAAAFDQQSVGGLRIKAQRFDTLVGLSAKNADLPARARALGSELLENPQQDPAPLAGVKKAFSETLSDYGESYAIWWNKAPGDNVLEQSRKGLADKQPAVKLLRLLDQASEKLGSGADMSGLEAEIDKQFALVKGADRGPLAQILKQYHELKSALDLSARIVGVSPDKGTAVELAQKQALAHADQCFGIVDRGWKDGAHQGFQVVQYPASDYAAKAGQAARTGQALLQVLRSSQGEVESVDRGKRDKGVTGPFVPGRVSEIILKQPRLEGALLRELGQRAKQIALDNYTHAIANYQAMTRDPNALIATLLEADQRGELKKVMEGMFAISTYGSQAAEKSLAPVAYQFQLMLSETRKLLAAGQSDQAAERVAQFLESPFYAALQTGAEKVLDALEEAKTETAGLDDGEAAFVLSAKLPFVREELYRQCGFGLDPGKGIPPMQEDELEQRLAKRQFVSTAEAVFSKYAEEWKDKEQVVNIAKTAGMVGLSIGIAVATGGAGGAAVGAGLISEGTMAVLGTGLAVAMTGASAVNEISHAEHDYRNAQANHASGMLSLEGLRAADKEKTLNYMAVIAQVGMAGVGMAARGAISPQTLRATLFTDAGLNVAGGLLNPRTYNADPKQFAVNLVMGCVISAVSSTAGNFAGRLGQQLASESRVQIVLDQESGQFLLLGAGDEPVPVTPLGNEGENSLRFRAADGTEFTTSIETTDVQLVKSAEPDMLKNVSPATKELAARVDALAAAKGDSVARRKIYELLLEDSPGVSDELKAQFLHEAEGNLAKIEAEQAAISAELATGPSPERSRDLLKKQIAPEEMMSKALATTVRNAPEAYTLKGSPIDPTAVHSDDGMSRVIGLESAYSRYMSKDTHAQLEQLGIHNARQFIEQVRARPDVFTQEYILSLLDPNAAISGNGDIGWWSVVGNSEAGNVNELIDELALNPDSYRGGAIRFTLTPEQAHDAQMRKPTPLDGMFFKEWAESPGTQMGTTGGGASEAVIRPVKVSETTSGDSSTEVFLEKRTP